jgi:hypothetical protein
MALHIAIHRQDGTNSGMAAVKEYEPVSPKALSQSRARRLPAGQRQRVADTTKRCCAMPAPRGARPAGTGRPASRAAGCDAPMRTSRPSAEWTPMKHAADIGAAGPEAPARSDIRGSSAPMLVPPMPFVFPDDGAR